MSAVALVKRTTCPDSSSIVLRTMITGAIHSRRHDRPPQCLEGSRVCAGVVTATPA